jgi:hypothetical protein
MGFDVAHDSVGYSTTTTEKPVRMAYDFPDITGWKRNQKGY